MRVTTYHGDCRDVLPTLDAQSVQTIVTSPPYYRLRKYSDDPREIGQEARPDCLAWARGDAPCGGGCYVCALRAVFAACWRVLRDDGVLFLNLGDSYAMDSKWGGASGSKNYTSAAGGIPRERIVTGLGDKQLLGIPWRIALALQADGWILRSDIVWAKGNAMPESVQDRPTRAHEYVFLFAKQKRYFYDALAIAEAAAKGAAGSRFDTGKTAVNGLGRTQEGERAEDGLRNRRTVWSINTTPYAGAHYAVMPEKLIEPCVLAGSLPLGAYEPDDIIETPIGDGERSADPSIETGRAGYNRPRRATEGTRPISRAEQRAYAEQLRASPHRAVMEGEAGSAFEHYVRTDLSGARPVPPDLLSSWIERGWLAAVSIPPRIADVSRSVVLDPFSGSGTVGRVALRLQRRAVLIELNKDYIEQHIEARTDGVQVEMFV